MASADEISSQIASAALKVWSSATVAVEQFAESIGITPSNTSSLERIVRPPIERSMAALRWSYGQNTVVPLPAPPLNDPRMLITIVGLARVLYEELDEHHLATALNPSISSQTSPLPLPPITTALVAASIWRYFTPALLRNVSLSPYCVVEQRQVFRLWSSCLTHLHAPHLLTNLAALLPDAAALERQSGSGHFAVDVAALAGLSSGLFVGWAVLEKELLNQPNTYYAVGAVGMSSLAFALQVVRGESRRGHQVVLLGIPLPAPYTWVVQLALTHLTAPDASFAGHLCGVLAGVLHVYVLRPVLHGLLRSQGVVVGAPQARAQQPRFYGSGTLSGRPVSSRSGGGGGGWLWRSVRGALTHLALAAAAVAVYSLSSQRRQRPPMSEWRLR